MISAERKPEISAQYDEQILNIEEVLRQTLEVIEGHGKDEKPSGLLNIWKVENTVYPLYIVVPEGVKIKIFPDSTAIRVVVVTHHSHELKNGSTVAEFNPICGGFSAFDGVSYGQYFQAPTYADIEGAGKPDKGLIAVTRGGVIDRQTYWHYNNDPVSGCVMFVGCHGKSRVSSSQHDNNYHGFVMME